MKITFIAFLLPLLIACSSGFGSKLAGDKLDVYFNEPSLERYADSLGSYWTKNGLVGSRKQSIRLEKPGTEFQVKLIQSREFEKESLSVVERAQMEELALDLSEKVFDGKTVGLVICDGEFKPIYEIKP